MLRWTELWRYLHLLESSEQHPSWSQPVQLSPNISLLLNCILLLDTRQEQLVTMAKTLHNVIILSPGRLDRSMCTLHAITYAHTHTHVIISVLRFHLWFYHVPMSHASSSWPNEMLPDGRRYPTTTNVFAQTVRSLCGSSLTKCQKILSFQIVH